MMEMCVSERGGGGGGGMICRLWAERSSWGDYTVDYIHDFVTVNLENALNNSE